MSKSLQDCAIYVAEQFEKHKVWYSWHNHKGTLKGTIASGSAHTSDCAHFVSLVLQEYGVLPEGKTFWLSSTINGGGASYIKSSKKLSVSYPKKSLKTCISQGIVKPGDIVGFNGPHTEIYLGKVGSNHKKWSGGPGGCEKSGGKYYFKKNKLYTNSNISRTVSVVIRIKDLNLGNIASLNAGESFSSTQESEESKAVRKMLKAAYAHVGEGGSFIWKWSGLQAAWCAMFVCWTVAQGFGDNWTKYVAKSWLASIPETSVKKCGATWIKEPGKSYKSVPQPGDIWAVSNSGGIFGHTGLVYSVDTKNKTFMSIEGNYSDKVATVKRSWSDCYCIARPKWGKVGATTTISSGGESSKYLTDNGGMMMPDNIALLYSSNNYELLEQEKKEKTISEKQGETIASAYKEAFNQLSNQVWDEQTSGGSLINQTSRNNVTGLMSDSKVNAIMDKFNYKAFNNKSVGGKNVASIELSDGKLKVKQGQLLSYPSLVEAPVIVIKLGGKTIGGYNNFGDPYPNYLTSMTIEKISGKINKYIINLTHQVRYGEDPNLIDKLLSKTGFTNKINILYGDAQLPGALFRDEEAIVTDVIFSEDVGSHKISYTITALSSIISSTSTTSTFASKTDKPSNLIRDLLYSNTNDSKLLLNSLPGMKNRELVEANNLIPTGDAIVTTQKMVGINPLTALNYYVSGMYNAITGNPYYLTIHDDVQSKYGGAYIQIKEFSYDQTNSNYFEVDVGYPGDNFVMGFNINSDVYFPLVYDYNNQLSKWVYDIDNNGDIVKTKSNSLLLNNNLQRKNVIQNNWWKKVTEYPISATLTIKGLTKPVMLGSYIKINTMFYGNKDLASGIYVILGQKDELSGNGYRTTLELLRVGSD